MSTCFMMINNPMDLVINITVDRDTYDTYFLLNGAIEKYKINFDAEYKQVIFTFKLLSNSILYKLRMISDTNNNLEELTDIDYFFKTVNILGLAIDRAKSKKKPLGIKVDTENSYVYLENLDSNNGTYYKFRGWLEY